MKRIAFLSALFFAFAGVTSFVEPQGKVDPPKIQPAKVGDFVERGRGYRPPTPEQRALNHAAARARHGDRLAVQAQNQTLPAAFDARAAGWVIPVGDQGQCGSCYLYSTIYGTMTQAFVKSGYGKNDGSFVLAVQYGMDCHNFGGCNGGNGTEVMAWAMQNGWPAESWVDLAGKLYQDYPKYAANSYSCRKVTGAKYWKPGNWGFATGDQSSRPATTAEIKTALFNYGALNVSLDAGGQFGNGTGTITSLGTGIDHEIELVAWDDADGTFTLKNQWSTSWGNGGYRKVTYKAAQNLVDVFWVSAGPLPPPPVPPVPPVPPAGAPVITSAPTATGTVGSPFSYTITATNSPLVYGETDLPAGLTLKGAVISGTPTTIAVSQVTLTAANASGIGSAVLTLTIGETPPPPGPGAQGNVTWTVNGITSSYELFPLGTRQKLAELRDIIGPIAP